jgi:hypothetical protein
MRGTSFEMRRRRTHRRFKMLIRFLAVVTLCASLGAQIDVPGDYPDPQTAIDNASAGAVIVIHGGIWGPLVIDKALTLVGDPRPYLEGDQTFGFGTQAPPIQLNGPGGGEVVLVNLQLGGTVNGATFSSACAGICGGGFDELHIFDCAIAGPEWVTLTGMADGASGIRVAVPYVLVVGSTVAASNGGADMCSPFMPDGVPGIAASASTVVVLDSVVTGGGTDDACYPYGGCGGSGGIGGPGIVASKVVEAGSTLLGGAGARWTDNLGTFCFYQPDGPLVVTGIHSVLANDLAAGPARLGQPFTLTWNTPGPIAEIYWSRGPATPFTLVAGLPEAHLDPATARLFRVVPAGGGPQSITLPIPGILALTGLELAFQVFDPSDYVTRPVVVVLRP